MSEIERVPVGGVVVEALLGLSPVVGPLLAGAWKVGRALDQRRIVQTAAAAVDASRDAERMARRITEDERLTEMFFLAIESARRTTWEAKRIAMGRVVAQAAADDADVDECAALVAALASIEAPHFRLMARLAGGELDELNSKSTIPEPYRSALVANGLVSSTITYDGDSRIASLSGFGHRLLGWVQRPRS